MKTLRTATHQSADRAHGAARRPPALQGSDRRPRRKTTGTLNTDTKPLGGERFSECPCKLHANGVQPPSQVPRGDTAAPPSRPVTSIPVGHTDNPPDPRNGVNRTVVLNRSVCSAGRRAGQPLLWVGQAGEQNSCWGGDRGVAGGLPKRPPPESVHQSKCCKLARACSDQTL